MRVIGKLLGVFAAFLAYSFYQSGRGPLGLENADWTLLIGAFASGVIAKILQMEADNHDQKQRDATGQAILDDLSRGVIRDFIFYLRPFELDGVMIESDPSSRNNALMVDLYNEPIKDSERMLEEALGDMCPVLSLGRQGENVGAARIETSDDAWLKEFARLAKAARGIIMMPGLSNGCVQEIQLLKTEGWLGKTVFIQPAAYEQHDVVKGHWEAVKPKLESLGFRAPEYQRDGSMFTFDSDGNSMVHGSPKLDKPRKCREVIERIWDAASKQE